MTAMDSAPPASSAKPSPGADGGFNSPDVRGYLLWAVSYGVASAIALRTIDALTSKRTNQHETDQKPKEIVVTAAASQAPEAKHRVPFICKHVFELYNHCLRGSYQSYYEDGAKCGDYVKIMKECQQMGSTTTNTSNISNRTISVSPDLIMMSYRGCKQSFDRSPCKKYETYMSGNIEDGI